MSFDSRSLDRLRQINQKLSLNKPLGKNSKTTSSKKNNKLHKVETEEDPQKLFHSLMDISPDGNVPPHLVYRLKETESNQLTSHNHNDVNEMNNFSGNIEIKSSNQESETKQERNLYASFRNLLREEEEEI